MESSEEISFSKLGEINNINSPFEILNGWQIDTLVEKKWDFFKVYPINGNTKEDVIKSNLEFQVRSKGEPSFHSADSWIIFKPNDYDNDTKEAYRKVKLYEKDLHKLSQMQTKLHKADIETDVSELRQKIKELFYKLFPEKKVDKPVKEEVGRKKNNVPLPVNELTLKELFMSLADYRDIMRKLCEKEYINTTQDTWLFGGRMKKSYILGLIKILTEHGYLKPREITTKDKIAVLKNSFHVSVSESTVTNDLGAKYANEFKIFIKKKVQKSQ